MRRRYIDYYKQIALHQRIENLPDGTKQSVMIDVRGQNVSDAALNALYDDIMQRINNGVEILFKMD